MCWYRDTGITLYVRDQGGNVLAEYGQQSNSARSKYIYAGSQRIAMINSAGILFFYLNDHLGSARALVRASDGVCYNKYYMWSFGSSRSETVSQNQMYKYTGKPFDDDAGLDLYYYGARYYDPALGRFLAVDPLAYKYPGWSPYMYCGNNPMKMVDVNGAWYIVKIHGPSGALDLHPGEWPRYQVVWETDFDVCMSMAPFWGFLYSTRHDKYGQSERLYTEDDVMPLFTSAVSNLLDLLIPGTSGIVNFGLSGYNRTLMLFGGVLAAAGGWADDPRLIERYHERWGYYSVTDPDELVRRILVLVAELEAEDATSEGEEENQATEDRLDDDDATTELNPFWNAGWGAEHQKAP